MVPNFGNNTCINSPIVGLGKRYKEKDPLHRSGEGSSSQKQ